MTLATITFVVRVPDDYDPDSDTDPRSLLTDDSVMFWSAQPGVTLEVRRAGAEPGDWATEQELTDIAVDDGYAALAASASEEELAERRAVHERHKKRRGDQSEED